jgi:hypothetical protein
MATRIVYRAVSVFFLAQGLAACAAAALSFLAQVKTGPDLGIVFLSLVLGFVGWLAIKVSRDAWRQGRYDPLYDKA